MEVRQCQLGDLPDLEAALPLGGPYGHDHRLQGQADGRWLYLIALDPLPVGACLVHWGGPVDEHVRAQFPDAAEIGSLFVAPAARGRGVGRALIATSEEQAALHGRTHIGVAVDDSNRDARRLYERLGFEPSGARFRVAYDYTDESGNTAHAVEEGDFLTKKLPAG